MISFARVCVALVYIGASICYFRSKKKYALFFGISAGVALVLAGLSTGFETSILCVALSIMNLALLMCVLFKKRDIKILSLTIFQLPLIVLWLFYYLK